MSNKMTQKFITTIFHEKPSFARDLSISLEALGLSKEKYPNVKILLKPQKIDKRLIQPFDSTSSTISNYLSRIGLSTNGVKVINPAKVRKLEAFMCDKDYEWQDHLKYAEEKFDEFQKQLWEKTVADAASIEDDEIKSKYLAYVQKQMPSKDEFVARHERFNWHVVPFFQGEFDMEGYDRVSEGLDYIRTGAVGSLIGEIAKTSTKLMEKVEKGNVQVASQRTMIDLIDKISEFSFLNSRLTDVSLEMLKKFRPLLKCVESVNDDSLLKELAILLKPLMNQDHLDDVVYYEESLFGEVKQKEIKESAIDIIRRRERELTEQTEAQKEAKKIRDANFLKKARSLVNPEIAAELEAELDNSKLLSLEEISAGESNEEPVSEKDFELVGQEEPVPSESDEIKFEMAPSLF